METNTTDKVTQQTPAQQTSTETVNSGSSQSAITQEHVSKLVGDARKEGKTTGVNDLLKALGVATSDELKALIEDAKKRKDSELTDSQRLQAERDKVAKEKSDLEAQLTTERAERRNDKIDTALRAEAAKLKAPDVDTVLLYARATHKTELEALMGEDGTLDTKKLTALLETIKQAKPHYFAAQPTGVRVPSNDGGRGQGQQTQKPDISKFRI